MGQVLADQVLRVVTGGWVVAAGLRPPGWGSRRLDTAIVVADSLIRFGRAEDPSYFQVEMGRDESAGLIVHRKAGDLPDGSTLLDRYHDLAAGIPLEFRDALFSHAEVRRIGDQIGSLVPKFRRLGCVLSDWYLEEAMGPYIIGYSATGRPPNAKVKKLLPPEIAPCLEFRVSEVSTL